MKKCPSCGEEIQDKAIFCRYCGQDLTEKERRVIPPSPGTFQISKKKKLNWVLTLILGLLVVFWGLLAYLVVMINNNRGGVSGRVSNTPTSDTPTVDAKIYVQLVPGSLNCSYSDSYGGVEIITGEIQNVSSQYTIESVGLIGTLASPDGTFIDTEGWQTGEEIAPNSTSTYSVFISDFNDQETQCSVSVAFADFK